MNLRLIQMSRKGNLCPLKINVPNANESTISAQGEKSAESTESRDDEARYPT